MEHSINNVVYEKDRQLDKEAALFIIDALSGVDDWFVSAQGRGPFNSDTEAIKFVNEHEGVPILICARRSGGDYSKLLLLSSDGDTYRLEDNSMGGVSGDCWPKETILPTAKALFTKMLNTEDTISEYKNAE